MLGSVGDDVVGEGGDGGGPVDAAGDGVGAGAPALPARLRTALQPIKYTWIPMAESGPQPW